jgi:guanylate kinase
MLRNKIVLVGKGGSGKDFMRKKLEGRGFIYAVSYTSRPARVNEVEGKDYYFLSKDLFMEHISEGFFYEYVEFNGWIYGTANWQMDECDIFIMTPKGISYIKPEDRKKCFIIYINPDSEIVRARLEERGDVDSVDRRIKADEMDFKDFTDFDIMIKNSDF